MTELAEVVDDLGSWLPVAAALIAEPDTDGSTGGGGKPGSRPPWNPAASAAYYDPHALIRDILGVFQVIVTGHSEPIPWSDAATAWALARIVTLSHAVPHDHVKRAARDLQHCVLVIEQLPAVDEAERPQRVAAECPYCHFAMMMLYPKSGRVTCLRYGSCFDADGHHPVGTADNGRLGPCVIWADGFVS